MKEKAAICLTFLLTILLTLMIGNVVSAARCQISNVSYTYPRQASQNEQVQVATNVAGSCASYGQDYYAVRVDLVDGLSNMIISSSNTPIGYAATHFNVTAENPAITPSYNVTWHLQIHVYVIRAGGTNGIYLLDYQTTGNATIQVGTIPVPEFHITLGIPILTTLIAATLILHRRRLREAN